MMLTCSPPAQPEGQRDCAFFCCQATTCTDPHTAMCAQVGETVTPEAVLAVSVPSLRACGLSERKVSSARQS